MNLEEYLQKNPKKHLIFDFDATVATLILPWSVLGNKLNMAFENISPEVAARCNTWNWSGYSESVKILGPSFKKMIDDLYLNFEAKYLEKIEPNDEIINFIIKNQTVYNFYIWSNNQRPTVLNALKELKIFNLFKKIVTATDVSIYKPEPEGFALIYDKKNKREDYLIIGDSEGDRKAAENVGIDFLKVVPS